eukprot:3886123-Amphidinium_carterae.2
MASLMEMMRFRSSETRLLQGVTLQKNGLTPCSIFHSKTAFSDDDCKRLLAHFLTTEAFSTTLTCTTS